MMHVIKILKATRSAVYRRNKNFLDIFVKAAFTEATLKNNSVNFSVMKYNTKMCSWGKNLVETATFKSNANDKVFKINDTHREN